MLSFGYRQAVPPIEWSVSPQKIVQWLNSKLPDGAEGQLRNHWWLVLRIQLKHRKMYTNDSNSVPNI